MAMKLPMPFVFRRLFAYIIRGDGAGGAGSLRGCRQPANRVEEKLVDRPPCPKCSNSARAEQNLNTLSRGTDLEQFPPTLSLKTFALSPPPL